MLRRARSHALITLILGLLVTFDISCGVRGVRFGSMWDEGFNLQGLRSSVHSVSSSQTGYYYGGLYYVPGYLVLAPKFLRHLPAALDEMRDLPSRPFAASKYPSLVAAQTEAFAALDAPEMVERIRVVFVWLVAFTIPLVFAASYWACGSRGAALGAAAATGLSWELSYHGRWIAVDSMLGLFGALVFVCLGAALHAPSERRALLLFRLAAVAAGLGLGCKMPGVFLMVPVLVARWLSLGTRTVAALLVSALETCALTGVVFVATTPSVVLDPLHYLNDMFRVAMDYNLIADDYPYCEPSFALRLLKIAGYCGSVLFSPYWPLAVAVTLFALAGAVIGIRERRPLILAILSFLIAYLGFVASQRLLMVRNLMVTVAPLAVLSSLGIERCAALVRRRLPWQVLLCSGAAGAAALNGVWLWSTAQTIGSMSTTNATILDRLDDYLSAHRSSRIYISPAVLGALKEYDPEAAKSLSPAPWSAAEQVVMYADALPGWTANTPRYATYFASMHANYDYYPGLLLWSGLKKMGDPILLLSKERVIAQGVKQAPAR